ncbi:MAG: DUF6797 domain-containing protein [Phycisphaeraceae bacterium]
MAAIEAWDEAAFQRGRQVYQSACIACHGADGQQTINPEALPFSSGEFRNGADPYSMFRTLTDGFETMPSVTWLTPQQRYDVIHYIRESFIRDQNADQYVNVDAEYLATLPEADETETTAPAQPTGTRDYGPALASQLGREVSAALTVKLDEQTTISYDLHRMRLVGAWQNGFLNLDATHHQQQRGEGVPLPDGQPLPGLEHWQWALGGNFEADSERLLPRRPAPPDWMRYRGRHVHGDRSVLSYDIAGRHVLELPEARPLGKGTAIVHTLEIAPGDEPLKLAVGKIEGEVGAVAGLLSLNGEPTGQRQGPVADQLALVTGELKGVSGAARYVADAERTAEQLSMGGETFSVAVRFRTTESGTLVANAPMAGPWARDAKALFVRGGRLVYDIGWLGAITSSTQVNDGEWRWGVLTSDNGEARLYVDGKLEAEEEAFARAHVSGHVFKIGAASPNFGGDYSGDIEHVAFYRRVLTEDEIATLVERNAPPGEATFVWPRDAEAEKANEADDSYGSFVAAAAVGDVEDLRWEIDQDHRVVLQIPAGAERRVVQVVRFAGEGEADVLQFASFARFAGSQQSVTQPSQLLEGGSQRWRDTVTVQGQLGDAVNGYALDTVPVPFDNPYNAWVRTTAVDFFRDGRGVVTTHGGDVWIVSGLDDELTQVTWQRYAAGLYEPMGVRVVNGDIYVTCRDGIIRLHDVNGNGEADYYETFFADPDVSTFFHAYNFDLVTDEAGNFYYTKAGQYTDYALPGSVMRVSPDGSSGEAIATGFRTPNGMGMLPDGRPTASDNEGSWMPASKISVIQEGGFYAYSQTHSGGNAWAPDGGRIDHTQVKPPADFDRPLVWMPRSLDASSGGQVWVDDERFGPLTGRLLHTSFSHGWMYAVLMQENDDGLIAGLVDALPHQFDAGIQRARQHPVDGQVWATGLSGWQGPAGGADGCLQRLRYVGEGGRFLTGFEVEPKGIRLRFNFALDAGEAANTDRYQVTQWNYKWTAGYGSAHHSVANPGQVGEDDVPVIEAQVDDEGHSVLLRMDAVQPIDQMRIDLDLRDASGEAFTEQIYLTIHRVPEAK